MSNPDILSERYATPEINDIFSERGRIIAERNLWIAVMKAQRELGLNIPAEDIEKFEKAKDDVDLDFIKRRELETKHDVKAKIEAFVKAAGAGQHIHKGMTSRDLTDNVEQMIYRDASKIILGRYVSVLRNMLDRARYYRDHVLTARTHHQPAQPTLLGRRFSMWAEEMIPHLEAFDRFLEDYPLRGIKGPVGTQFDMLVLFGGDKEKVEVLEQRIARELGFGRTLHSTGQVYPRSLDSAILTNLALLSASPSNFATTMRLMAGFGLVDEGFEEGQTGSSAMPYKMNTRSCERVNGFANVIQGFSDMMSRVSGDQWAEGDVSDSVVRRVAMPGAFYASDGLVETTLTVLNRMQAYEGEIVHELDKYLPFMATTELLQRAVLSGVGREDAHKAIKKHALEESRRMKREGSSDNRLLELLATEELFARARIGLDDMRRVVQDEKHFVGNADSQIDRVVARASRIREKYSTQEAYEPMPIL